MPKGKLTVWLPFECENTSWVTVDYISQALCDLVKQYANLGVWGMEKAKDFDFVKKHIHHILLKLTEYKTVTIRDCKF